MKLMLTKTGDASHIGGVTHGPETIYGGTKKSLVRVGPRVGYRASSFNTKMPQTQRPTDRQI